jgi:hypothetical protein
VKAHKDYKCANYLKFSNTLILPVVLPPINGPSFGDGVLDVSAAFLGNERLPD